MFGDNKVYHLYDSEVNDENVLQHFFVELITLHFTHTIFTVLFPGPPT